MTFFENLGKKAAEVAQSASKKTGDLVEITKLTLSITNEEEKLKNLQKELGQKIYAKFSAQEEVPDDVKELCKTIKDLEVSITEIKSKILDVKNQKICPSCKEEIDVSVAFCPNCGAQQENQQQILEEETVKHCSHCGKQAEIGHSFCSGCGTKL